MGSCKGLGHLIELKARNDPPAAGRTSWTREDAALSMRLLVEEN